MDWGVCDDQEYNDNCSIKGFEFINCKNCNNSKCITCKFPYLKDKYEICSV